LGRECPVELAEQPHLAEPLTRVNSQPAAFTSDDQTRFWDDYVAWYQGLKAEGVLG
jgi:hypothetical protein